MSTTSNSSAKRLRQVGVGGMAALIGFAGVATASPAYAALATSGGDIRVLPTDATSNALVQPAPWGKAGATTAAASMQVAIPNAFAAGDRVLVQLFDNANNNCADAAHAVAYDATPTVAVREKPLASGQLKVNTSAGPDGTTSGAAADVKPEIGATLVSSSTACDAVGVKDAVAITFKNASAGTATDAWVVDITDVKIAVGASVPPGPIRAVPIAHNAVPASTPPSWIPNTAMFAGNANGYGGVSKLIKLWTNPLIVQPVELTLGTPSKIVADGTCQTIGDVTLSELAVNSMPAGNYYVYASGGAWFDGGTPAPTKTGFAAGDSLSVYSSYLKVSLAAPSATAKETYVIKGVRACTNTAGPVKLQLSASPFLGPDDRSLGVSAISDVDGSPFIDSNSITALALPNRIGGNDRYETAAKIAMNAGCQSSESQSGRYAVLASGENFPDALSGNFLAGRLADYSDVDNVPVLLTNKDSVPASTLVALRNLGVRHVYIVGSTGAVSSAVQSTLEGTRAYYCGGEAYDNNQNLEVVRIGGADRYATNRLTIQAATQIIPPGWNGYQMQWKIGAAGQKTAIIAAGDDSLGGADALSAGPAAYRYFPLVLTPSSGLGPDATQVFDNLGIETAVVLGGTGSVSAGAESAMNAAGVSTLARLAGADRWETSTKLAEWEMTGNATASSIAGLGWGWEDASGKTHSGQYFLANGLRFPDALAGGALAGSQSVPVLLTPQGPLPASTVAFLKDHAAGTSKIIALGLTDSVSQSTLSAAQAAVTP